MRRPATIIGCTLFAAAIAASLLVRQHGHLALAGTGGRGAIADRALEASELELLDRDIAFFADRARRDTLGALDRASLAALYLQRARLTGNGDDDIRAEEAARQSLALRTVRNASTYTILASSLLAQHRFLDAREAARELVRAEPDDPAARALLGEIQLEVGEYDSARVLLEPLAGMRENLAVGPRLARWAEIAGRSEDARAIFNAALREVAERTDLLPEQAAWFYLRRGQLELKAGGLDGAANAFRAGLEIHPGDHRILGALARLELLRGRPGRAIGYGERAIAIALEPGTLGVLGDAHIARGDSVQAKDHYRAMEVAVLAQPGAFHREWSLWLLDHGRGIDQVLAKAREEIRTRRDVYGYDLLAWALHKSGNHVEAREAAQMALRLGTRDASLYFHAGMIARALGDTATARRELEEALEINSYFHPTQPAVARATLDSIRHGRVQVALEVR
ncbi:MAG: tetratricopeptide repeat protein [Gemmatimonadota bacterium]|nr:tetratricopeptide repeat protein [Gemmatimonadota bacterium]